MPTAALRQIAASQAKGPNSRSCFLGARGVDAGRYEEWEAWMPFLEEGGVGFARARVPLGSVSSPQGATSNNRVTDRNKAEATLAPADLASAGPALDAVEQEGSTATSRSSTAALAPAPTGRCLGPSKSTNHSEL